MSSNNIGLNAGVPNLASWPGMATTADITNLQNQINALSSALRIAADISNSNSAAPLDMGISIPVVAGTTKTIRATLFVTMGNTGGIVVRVLHPAATLNHTALRLNSTGISVVAVDYITSAASPNNLGSRMTYTGSGIYIIDMIILPSANGNVTFDFAPTVNTQNMTIRGGSYFTTV